MKRHIDEVLKDWEIEKTVEVLEDFLWLKSDPLPDGKLTRELGIKEKGGKIYRIDRILDKNGNFCGFYDRETRRLWTGRINVSTKDVRG